MGKKNTDIKMIEDKLRSYNVLIIEIENLEIDLEDYIEKSGTGEISLGSKSNNPLPGRVTAKPVSSQVENILIGAVTDADAKYFRLQECKRLVRKVDNILDKLNDRDRRLIEGFYIKGETLLDLSIELDRTSQHLCAVKKNILRTYFKSLIK